MSQQNEQAGCLISAVGSLSVVQLRVAVAGSSGAVIGLLPDWRFNRELDPATGYPELRISPQAPN